MPLAIGEITIINLNDVNISTTPPLDPVEDQLWLNTGVVPNVLRRWAWDKDEEEWGWVNASPTNAEEVGAETPEGAQTKADAAKNYALAILKALADGEYDDGAFIAGKSLIAPTVVGLQGTFAELLAGDPFGARLEMGEGEAGEPFMEAYDAASVLRVRVEKDGIVFLDDQGRLAGKVYALTNPTFLPELIVSAHSERSLSLQADKPIYLHAPKVELQARGGTGTPYNDETVLSSAVRYFHIDTWGPGPTGEGARVRKITMDDSNTNLFGNVEINGHEAVYFADCEEWDDD